MKVMLQIENFASDRGFGLIKIIRKIYFISQYKFVSDRKIRFRLRILLDIAWFFYRSKKSIHIEKFALDSVFLFISQYKLASYCNKNSVYIAAERKKKSDSGFRFKSRKQFAPYEWPFKAFIPIHIMWTYREGVT